MALSSIPFPRKPRNWGHWVMVSDCPERVIEAVKQAGTNSSNRKQRIGSGLMINLTVRRKIGKLVTKWITPLLN
jgi:hypothetical protein